MAVYTFSWTWFFVGLLIVAFGAVVTLYFNKFAEHSGVGNFSKWRIAGLIFIGIGFIFMFNLHTYFLMMLVQLIVSGM